MLAQQAIYKLNSLHRPILLLSLNWGCLPMVEQGHREALHVFSLMPQLFSYQIAWGR